MFLTTHAAAGLALSTISPNPLAAFGFGFLSHFVLDFIPHGDERIFRDEEWKVHHKYRWVALLNLVDFSALTMLIILTSSLTGLPDDSRVAMAILGSIVPDFLSNFFPIIHERLSWLWLVRWLYAITKPTGLRYFARFQNWIHNIFHHEIIRRQISFQLGLSIQMVVIAVCLLLVG